MRANSADRPMSRQEGKGLAKRLAGCRWRGWGFSPPQRPSPAHFFSVKSESSVTQPVVSREVRTEPHEVLMAG